MAGESVGIPPILPVLIGVVPNAKEGLGTERDVALAPYLRRKDAPYSVADFRPMKRNSSTVADVI